MTAKSPPLFERVTLIGLGLIGSSLSHAIRRAGLARRIDGYARSAETRAVARRSASSTPCMKARRRRRRAPTSSSSARRSVSSARGARHRSRLEARCHRQRCRLGQERRDPRRPAASAQGGAFRARPSGRRHRTIGPAAGFAELFDNRWCILTPPPRRRAGGEAGRLTAFWQGCGSLVEEMDAAPSRSRARHHQPCASSHRLQYRRHGRRSRERHPSEVIKFPPAAFAISPASPRPIPPCGATCSSTTARRCSKCWAASPKILRRCSARSAGATAKRCSTCSPAPGPSAARSSTPARKRAAPDFGRGQEAGQ